MGGGAAGMQHTLHQHSEVTSIHAAGARRRTATRATRAARVTCCVRGRRGARRMYDVRPVSAGMLPSVGARAARVTLR